MESKYKGGTAALFFFTLLTYLTIILSFGLAYPAMKAVYLRWRADRTEINGLKLKFTGKAKDFYARYLVMYTLSYLTFGIYFLVVMKLELLKWQISDLHVQDREDYVSETDIKWYQLIGATLLKNFVSVITLGIAAPFCIFEYRMWLVGRIYVNGAKLDFYGNEYKFFAQYLLWGFLSVITVGIYYIWAYKKMFCLTVSYISFADKRYVTEGTAVYLIPKPPVLPKEPPAALPPVKGEVFERVSNFLKLKRAMICFVCEVPFFILFVLLFTVLFFTNPLLAAFVLPLYNLFVFSVVLLSMPTVFLVEERLGNVNKVNLGACTAMAVCGIIFSVAMPVFMPVFIGGLVHTNRMKKYLYKDYKNGELSANGEAFIEEEEKYYDDAKSYQNYLWDRKTYMRSIKKYAKKSLYRSERVKKASALTCKQTGSK